VLLSMTGHGEAYVHEHGAAVTIEVRTINSRYFKLVVRAGEGYLCLEPRIEDVTRQRVRRGTVQVAVRVDREFSPETYRLNGSVLEGYHRQLADLCQQMHLPGSIHLESLLMLPGVISEQGDDQTRAEQDWPIVEKTLHRALDNLERMRADEGRAMAADLEANCREIAAHLDGIRAQAPLVADSYRAKLTERLNKLLAEYSVRTEPADVIREVGMFAERSDVSEELVRLDSHIAQFRAFVEDRESSGRKLDFLTQEMFREANTVGAKANDAGIARHVVEIKASIERMREMVQNVE